MEGEFWKDVEEFPCSYEVSNFGRIRGKDKVVIKSDGVTCTRKGKILKLAVAKFNCVRVRLCVQGEKFTRSVTRLVALAFIPNPENKLEVNHKDGNRLNNRIDNLEWVTKQENTEHAVESGLINNPFGSKARNFKAPVDVIQNDIVIDTLFGNRDMIEKGYCYKQVSAVLNGKQKTHKGFYFKRQETTNEPTTAS